MARHLVLLPALLISFAVQQGPAAARPASQDLIDAINRARADPPGYAAQLQSYRRAFKGLAVYPPGGTAMMTEEGVRAVDDAIAFLRRQAPLAPITQVSPLARSAAAHARDQSASGAVGHVGRDGSTPSQRILRQGRWTGAAAEAIAYGGGDAAEIIRQLIVDDGVADRGHRHILFNPQLQDAGGDCESHPTYSQVCVLDFVAAMVDGAGPVRRPIP